MSSERVFNYIKLLLDVIAHTSMKSVLVDCKGKPFGDVWQEIVKLVQSTNILNFVNKRIPNETPYVIHELVGIEATPEIKEYLCTKFDCPEEIEIKEESLNDEIDLDLSLDDELLPIPREKPIVAKEDGEDIELDLGSDDDIINPEANDAIINDLVQLAETTKVEAKPAPAVSKSKAKTSKPATSRAPKTWETSLVGDVHEANLSSFDELDYKPEWIKIINEVKSSLNELLAMKINFFAVGIESSPLHLMCFLGTKMTASGNGCSACMAAPEMIQYLWHNYHLSSGDGFRSGVGAPGRFYQYILL